MSWICHYCETENPDSQAECEVCGSPIPRRKSTCSVKYTPPVIETSIYDVSQNYTDFLFPFTRVIEVEENYDWEKIYNEPYEITPPYKYIWSLKKAANNGDIWDKSFWLGVI